MTEFEKSGAHKDELSTIFGVHLHGQLETKCLGGLPKIFVDGAAQPADNDSVSEE